MTGYGTGRTTSEETRAIADLLARSCQGAGMTAEVLDATRVRVSLPNAHKGLAETIRIIPGPDGVLSFYWSWDERIHPTTEIAGTVALIKHVVTPPLHSVF